MNQGMDSFFDGIVDGGRLDVFVKDNVQLPKVTKENYSRAVEEIVSFLNKEADYGSGQPRDFPWKFKRVFKSGSLQKGTAVRGHADVDLVCFIEKGKNLQSPEEFLNKRGQILDDIANKFGGYHNWIKEGSRWVGDIRGFPVQHQKTFVPLYNFHNEYLLNVKLVEASGVENYSLPENSDESESDEAIIDVDIIPGFDLYDHLGQKPGVREGVGVFQFIESQEHPMKFADQFSASLAEMQYDFIRDRLNRSNNNNLKKLMLLVKYWFKTEVKSRFNRVRFPSYLIELLCLHVWETHLQGTKYDALTWFFQVLIVIERKNELAVVWREKYSGEGLVVVDVPWQVSEQRPLIADPANPFNNVAGGVAQWPEIFACAKQFKLLLKEKYKDAVDLRMAGVPNPPRSKAFSLDTNDEDVALAGSYELQNQANAALLEDSSQSFVRSPSIGCEGIRPVSLTPEGPSCESRIVPRSRSLRKTDFAMGGAADWRTRDSDSSSKADAKAQSSDISKTFGYLAAGALGAALGAGACYMLAQNDREKKKTRDQAKD